MIMYGVVIHTPPILKHTSSLYRCETIWW